MQIPSDTFPFVSNIIEEICPSFVYNYSLLEGLKIVGSQISMDEKKKRPKMMSI